MLGAQLLSRKKKSAVSLTQTGKRFLEEARATLRQAENAELVAKRAARGDIGSIALGYILSASCIGLLPELIEEFQKGNPGVSLQISRMETFPQMKAIVEGDLDIGFIRAPQRYPTELTGFVVDRHSYYVAIPERHPLAKRKQITPAILAKERFVSGPLEMDVGFWGNLGAISKPGQSLQIAERTSDIFSLLTSRRSGCRAWNNLGSHAERRNSRCCMPKNYRRFARSRDRGGLPKERKCSGCKIIYTTAPNKGAGACLTLNVLH